MFLDIFKGKKAIEEEPVVEEIKQEVIEAPQLPEIIKMKEELLQAHQHFVPSVWTTVATPVNITLSTHPHLEELEQLRKDYITLKAEHDACQKYGEETVLEIINHRNYLLSELSKMEFEIRKMKMSKKYFFQEEEIK